jgi:hypothetical protein
MITTPHRLSQQRCLRLRLRDCLMLFCVVFTLAGCTTAQVDSVPTPNSVQPTVVGTNLSFTTIAQGEHLSANLFVDKPSIIVIASAQEVEAALRLAAGDPPQFAMDSHPINQARQMDYNTSFAILVLQGRQGSSGYSVMVQQLIRQGDIVRVATTFIRPGFGQGVRDEGTDPYHLVAVSKVGTWGKEVDFELIDNGSVITKTRHLIP